MNDRPAPGRPGGRTAAQIAAAHPETSVWVSANAGTGKTGVLVDRISRLLLSHVRPERILCLTFTKAAAAEMANRLSQRLSDWAAMDEATLRGALAGLTDGVPTAGDVSLARRLFAMTLEAPEGLRIRTIHSFCESLLGRFPLEARVLPDFRVMDERDAREMQTQARDRVLIQAEASGTGLTDALYALAGLVDETAFGELIAELSSNRGRFRAALARHGGAEGLVAAVYAALGLDPGETVATILRAHCEDVPCRRGDLERLAAAWGEGSATDKDKALLVREWLALDLGARAADWRRGPASAFLTQTGAPAKRLLTNGAKAFDPEAEELALSYQAHVLDLLEKLKAANTAAATAALVRVGSALIESYDGLKDLHGRLDYDDLIERASGLLGTREGVSWVHYKLDGGIEHVLVDEAQDTSPAQWQVIDSLTSEFFAGEGRYEESGAEHPRTIFAVGDEKQSIYSFQGADPSMFGTMKQRFGAAVNAAGQVWNPLEMEQSFRSTPVILDLVDKVFEDPEAAKGVSFGGTEIFHRSARTGQAGLVELWPKEAPAEDDDTSEPWDAPVDHLAVDSPAARVADRIARTVKGWIDRGEPLPAQGRAVRPGDVLILLRTRGSFAEEMVRRLKDLGVPVSGRDRMVLTDQLAIQDLVALGRLTLLPEDDLNTACVLKGPFVELTERQLYDLAHDRKGSLLDALRAMQGEDNAFGRAWRRITEWRNRADFMPPHEFFAELLGPDGGKRDLMAHLGSEAAEPVDDFLAAALEYERDHVPSLEGFLHWLETGAAEVKRDLEQGRNEVRVMTVHGAKGLQAEIVFLADSCTLPARQNLDRIRWSEDDSLPLWAGAAANETAAQIALKDGLWAATLEEYRRLLYVAMTRAKDRLYVAGFEGKRPSGEATWYDLVETAMRELAVEVPDPRGGSVLRLEEPQTAAPDGGAAELALVGGAVDLPEWARRPPRPEPEPPNPLMPSRPAEDDPAVVSPLGSDGSGRFKRGLLIHTLLQTLPELPADRRREAAVGFLASPAHGLDSTAAEEMAAECLAVLDDPDLAPLFGPGSRAEVAVSGLVEGREGPRAISGQMDRILVAPDRVLVADYKTNRPAPGREDDVPAAYLRQMAAYRAALGAIYPDRPVECVLIWTESPRAMRLSPSLLDRHAP